MRGLLTTAILLTSFVTLHTTDCITLKTDRDAFLGGNARPLGVRVPLKEGQAKDAARIAVVNTKGGALPTQCEARTHWPDGSIQWLWADFAGAVEDGLQLSVNSRMSVVDEKKRLVVSNGVMRVSWDKLHAMPKLVEMNVGGMIKPVASSDGDGVFVVEQSHARCMLSGEMAELKFEVETRNALRMMIRVDGWYVLGDGERVARSIVRWGSRG